MARSILVDTFGLLGVALILYGVSELAGTAAACITAGIMMVVAVAKITRTMGVSNNADGSDLR